LVQRNPQIHLVVVVVQIDPIVLVEAKELVVMVEPLENVLEI
jgi:hypothetical protein